MAERERVICAAGELLEAGRGVRFETQYRGETAPVIAVRVRGQVHAYLNRCTHIAMELDWMPGILFDAAGREFDMLDPRGGVCGGQR